MKLHHQLSEARFLLSVVAVCCLVMLASACTTRKDGSTPDQAPDEPTSTQSESGDTSSPTPPPPPSAEHPPADWDGKPDGREWTDIAHIAIVDHGSGLLTATPLDIGDYCPSYDRLDPKQRRAFWVFLLSRLARFESNHDPSVSFTESFNDAQGNPVVSRGLLQISKESANGYGCAIVDATELHDPETNIRCGVRILNRWVAERDKVVAAKTDGEWRGAARYWSPFRNDSKRTQIASATASQAFCQ